MTKEHIPDYIHEHLILNVFPHEIRKVNYSGFQWIKVIDATDLKFLGKKSPGNTDVDDQLLAISPDQKVEVLDYHILAILALYSSNFEDARNRVTRTIEFLNIDQEKLFAFFQLYIQQRQLLADDAITSEAYLNSLVQPAKDIKLMTIVMAEHFMNSNIPDHLLSDTRLPSSILLKYGYDHNPMDKVTGTRPTVVRSFKSFQPEPAQR